MNIYRDYVSRADYMAENTSSTQNQFPRNADETQSQNADRVSGTSENTDDQKAEKSTEKTGIQGSQGAEDKYDNELSEEEQKQVQELKEIDRKVRQHEMAHLAAAQGIAVSGANFEYKRGPDGMNYAVGGDVQIDASKERDPEATIDKARRIVTAALAPSDPSPQDRSVAAKARAMEAEARAELAKEGQKEAQRTGRQQPENPFGTGNTDQRNKGISAEIATNSVGSTDNQPHPGIKVYEQTQAFVGGLVGLGTISSRSSILDIAA
jgi:hypothetical protein